MQNAVDPDQRQRRWRPELLAIASASGVAFVLLALVVAGGPLAMDLTVGEWLRPLRFGPSGVLVDSVNLLGEAVTWDLLVVLAAVVLWWRGRRAEAVILVAGVICAEAGTSVAKILVARGRPPGIEVVDFISHASYPSGHVVRAVVTSGLVAAMASGWPGRALPATRRWGTARDATTAPDAMANRAPFAALAAVAFATLMGIARIAVGEHWFTDVVGAALYGVVVLAVIGLLVDLARGDLARGDLAVSGRGQRGGRSSVQ